jgi:MFS family permease
MGSSVLMPLYVQTVMGYSAVISGLVTLPGSLATALVSPFAGRLYDKVGIRKIFIPGSKLHALFRFQKNKKITILKVPYCICYFETV